jgi:hypothetical protein
MFVGKAGSGKDTAAGILNEIVGGTQISLAAPLKEFAENVLGFDHQALWGPSELRNAVAKNLDGPKVLENCLYNNPHEAEEWLKKIGLPNAGGDLETWVANECDRGHPNPRPITARRLLQSLGTEFGRTQNPDVWINYAIKQAHAHLATPECHLVTISDGRFRNEVLAVKKVGGMVVKIIDNDEVKLSGESGQHPSETELETIPHWWFNQTVINYKHLGLDWLRNRISSMWEELNNIGPPTECSCQTTY